jgi:hypothetical protein
MRHRLIYARGIGRPSWLVWGRDTALASAEAAFLADGIPIAVVEASEDGMVCNHFTTVGSKRAKRADAELRRRVP